MSVGAYAQADHLDIIKANGRIGADIASAKAQANTEPPKTDDGQELSVFYHKRGVARHRLGDYPNGGWVDPKRVCIAGASYGGYATLMGLVRNHELCRCGIEWVGVTDIKLMYTITWSDISDEAKGYSMPVLIGDPVADAQQLKDTSPLGQAAHVRRPLLMAYGAADRRVPLEHGTEFRDAVSRTNKEVEWIVYRDEGHGWRTLETQVDFWTRVEKFLDRHLRVDAK